MNPELPRNPREELELRLTALLLGELSTDEATAVRTAMAKDAELSKLHDDLKQTIHLVRSAAKSESEPTAQQAEQLKLSDERRKKLLTGFAIPPLKKSDVKPKRSVRFTLIELLAVLSIVAILAAMMLPALSKAKSRSQSVAVRSNLRQLEMAKQIWAEDNKKSPDAAPTMEDLKPYLGGHGTVVAVGGETYVLGKVGESVSAEVDAKQARTAFGRLPASTAASGPRGERMRLSADGKWSFVDRSETTRLSAVSGRERGTENLGEEFRTLGRPASTVSLGSAGDTVNFDSAIAPTAAPVTVNGSVLQADAAQQFYSAPLASEASTPATPPPLASAAPRQQIVLPSINDHDVDGLASDDVFRKNQGVGSTTLFEDTPETTKGLEMNARGSVSRTEPPVSQNRFVARSDYLADNDALVPQFQSEEKSKTTWGTKESHSWWDADHNVPPASGKPAENFSYGLTTNSTLAGDFTANKSDAGGFFFKLGGDRVGGGTGGAGGQHGQGGGTAGVPGINVSGGSSGDGGGGVGSSRVDLQACKLEYSIVSPK